MKVIQTSLLFWARSMAPARALLDISQAQH